MADVCTCSGRKPIPIIRAGIRRRNGNRAIRRIAKGGENLSLSYENASDDSILNRELHSLRHAGRPLTPLLDPLEVLDCKSPRM